MKTKLAWLLLFPVLASGADWFEQQGARVERDARGNIVTVDLTGVWVSDADLERLSGLGNLNRLLPGTMGVAMGRNPNGAVRDIAGRYGVLKEVPVTLAGLVASLVLASGLALTGVLTGWGLVFAAALSLVVWPQTAEIAMARRSPTGSTPTSLEWAGIERPITASELHAIDAHLGLEPSYDVVIG